MKLIMEDPLLLDGSIEETLNEGTGNTERNYYISGIFSTPEAKNRNGRIYSRAIWEREVQKYQKEINEKSVNTLGEWQHPPRSTVDPIKAVMRIVELKMDANGNVVGKAKILNDNTEATNKLKGLIKEGVKIGVSSRGVGKVSATGVVEDFKLITYDAVDMPSDYNAMLNGVVEGYKFENGVMLDKEFIIDENGCIGEACGLAQEQIKEAKENNEPCPIQEKIDAAVKEAKEEIIEGISSYLSDFRKEINETNDTLVEGISDYLEKIADDKISEAFKDEVNVEEAQKTTLINEEIAKDIIKAIREKEEKENEEKKCAECGRELDDEEEELCDKCKEKVEDKDEEKVEEDYFSKLKNKVFK